MKDNVVRLHPIPEDAVFLHCSMCVEGRLRPDISVFEFEEDGVTYVTVWCERHSEEVATTCIVARGADGGPVRDDE